MLRFSAIRTIDPNPVSALQVIVFFGFALIGIGIFLPWVDEPQLRVYVLGMESGFERQWGKRLFFGAALGTILVLGSLIPHVRWSRIGPILAAIGVGTVLVTVYTTPLTGQYSPAIGVYVTLLGGLLVTSAAFASFLKPYICSP